MDKLSIIIPCCNEAEALPFFWREIRGTADGMEAAGQASFEFLFVDDGSRDGTLGLLRQFAAEDGRARYLSFSRNFGKEAAMYAGFRHATGDFVAVMDADLQDPPSLLPEMYETVRSGEYDSVATRRVSRKGEPPVRSFFARCFYRLMDRISDAGMMDGARDYRLMSRQMIDAILSMCEYNRFSKGIFGWVGFRTRWLSYENVERVAGSSKWSFWRLFRYSLEGITAFSVVPLAAASVLGCVLFLAALVYGCVIVVKTLLWGDPVGGYPSMMCVILLLGGIELLCMGIMGQYLAKTYLETKRRPIYLIAETESGRGAPVHRDSEGSAKNETMV